MMRLRATKFLSVALVLAAGACGEPAGRPNSVESALAGPPVRISELHYDNDGADVGEQVEISAPAGTDLTGYTVVLYNGSGGANYSPLVTLSGVVPATCGERGVLVFPAAGMQNGAPDGLALVAPGGVVVEFLSYEGTFTATAGAANGLTSVDIGVSESGTSPIGNSLGRTPEGTWSPSAPNTFGACNDNGDTQPPAEVASVTISPTSATLLVGGTQPFTAAAFDAASNPIPGTTFTFTSSATAVATVNANGLVTAVSAGDGARQ